MTRGSKSLSWRRFLERIRNPRTEPDTRPTRVHNRLEVDRDGRQHRWRERGGKVDR